MFATSAAAHVHESLSPLHLHDRIAPTDFAWRVLEEIDYGLLLVSPSGLLQHANHLARSELARERFLRLSNALVTGHTPAQDEELQSAIQAAAFGRRQMVLLRHDDGQSLPLACVPLLAPAHGESAAVLLMLGRQGGNGNLAASFFARAHGLTRAEEAVLRGLCDGLDVREIAIAHKVSEYTVRTQVRSLRDKTGINSMRLLVQKVAALPPVVMNGATLRTLG